MLNCKTRAHNDQNNMVSLLQKKKKNQYGKPKWRNHNTIKILSHIKFLMIEICILKIGFDPCD